MEFAISWMMPELVTTDPGVNVYIDVDKTRGVLRTWSTNGEGSFTYIYIYTYIYTYTYIYIYYPRVLTMDPFTRSQLAIHQWLPMALLTDRGAATEFAAPGAGSANDLSPKLGPCRVNWSQP